MKGFPGSPVVKNPPANAGDSRDAGLTLDGEDPPEKENGNLLSILVWKIPQTEEPGQELKRSDTARLEVEKSQTQLSDSTTTNTPGTQEKTAYRLVITITRTRPMTVRF